MQDNYSEIFENNLKRLFDGCGGIYLSQDDRDHQRSLIQTAVQEMMDS